MRGTGDTCRHSFAGKGMAESLHLAGVKNCVFLKQPAQSPANDRPGADQHFLRMWEGAAMGAQRAPLNIR
jgi:hypothetical protein